MPEHRTIVGDVTVIAVSDGRLEFAPDEFFPTVEAVAWKPYADQLTQDGKVPMNIGSFLLRSGGTTVLVDTGLGSGPHTLPGAVSGLLLTSMAAASLRPEDVDIVVITHLHQDHVGWNLVGEGDSARLTFPNARYRVPRADWDLYTRRAGMSAFSYIQHQVVPLEELGVLDLMDGETSFTSEVSALPTPGHTPGHTSVLISSQGELGIILGDAAHLPLQAHETDWSPRADADPVLSRATRHQVMDRIEHDGSLAISGHFPEPGFGRLVRLRGRRYWQAL